MTRPITDTDDDRIDMRLHEIERAYYDPRADFLVGVALDDIVSPATEKRLLREAERMFNTCRVVIRTGGRGRNVRHGVVVALRRMGA
jgi:hypothetical protein